MSPTTNLSPSEDELRRALIALRADNPSLGIAKLHALLLSTHSAWAVSEKRTRKILQNEGLVLTSNRSTTRSTSDQSAASTDVKKFPLSALVEGLDISKWTSKIEVKYFDKIKGKGLVAKEKLSQGEVIWKEDHFVLAPEWEIYDLQKSSLACSFCSTPLQDSPIAISCPSSASSTGHTCPARFCNRLCLSRSGRTHPLLCPSQNPASVPLLRFARRTEWMALHALAQCTARLLLTYQQDESAWESDWKFVRSLAQLGMEERAKDEWMNGVEVDRETWKKGHQLFLQAFQEPAAAPEKKKLARLLKKPLGKEIADALFPYESFLLGLGRMNLNIEAHGGIYVLHSHLNHSCSPNVAIRHLDQRTALSRITVIAKQDIQPGEELCITYVNPDLPVDLRRRQIMEWGFGLCQCPRCIAEGSDSPDKAQKAVPTLDLGDLESELKAGLGML
ncbi:hypothetical protein POSPLADRAFT_1049746 [Postia placenta MAD-698-R-SB12]|uniref:Histone-lysine N-methyltransferase SET5 n=1 Tax=Postia placenta MAD-698-R-SB12 TaxID=670580 RepID=A0A1X6MNW1_9APHY|nr:hypothetical protein POSPLADRAFT_1049746 [Postia placenta MAD-698-R-SB12]OSX58018.1 hypothetical protein POSPLADRAFT_1049746 [Postia placenta MAD-698-R-SB12]